MAVGTVFRDGRRGGNPPALRPVVWLAVLYCTVAASSTAQAWGWGHKFINLWAIARLPEWQHEYFGDDELAKLTDAYKSIQDAYAGSKSPTWAPYCNPPEKVSLHDPPPVAAGAVDMAWYLERIREQMQAGNPDEAMKYLGVLCHWNEDPGSPSAHNHYLSESFMQAMVPAPEELLGRTYTFGYKGIHAFDASSPAALHDDEAYTPRLLGATPAEAALRMAQRQRLLALRSARATVRLCVYYTDGDQEKAAALLRDHVTWNARFVADILYTAGCIASGRFDPAEVAALADEPLADWLPNTLFTAENQLHARPYYTRPYLVDHAYDAKREVHPLAFAGDPDGTALRGFGTTAPYTIEFTVAPGGVFAEFTCRVGLHRTADPAGKAVFAVLVDGEEVARSPELAGGQPSAALTVPLPMDAASFVLGLKVVPGEGADRDNCLPIWAEPTLRRRLAP